MKKIELSGKKGEGKYTIVDEKDFEKLNKISCNFNGKYAIGQKNNKKIKLHRLILCTPNGMQTDHINFDKLDNRRANLRICTNSQNMAHRKKMAKNTSSKYRGVSWHKCSKKWIATVRINKKSIHLGVFLDEKDAALAYDKRAAELFGEFAFTNFQMSP